MIVDDFISNCVDDNFVWKKGTHAEKEGYFVKNERLGTIAHFTSKAIEDNTWPTLRSQIQQGKDVRQVSRVVGYFSRIQNWNPSKLGELKARQAGNYKI